MNAARRSLPLFLPYIAAALAALLSFCPASAMVQVNPKFHAQQHEQQLLRKELERRWLMRDFDHLVSEGSELWLTQEVIAADLYFAGNAAKADPVIGDLLRSPALWYWPVTADGAARPLSHFGAAPGTPFITELDGTPTLGIRAAPLGLRIVAEDKRPDRWRVRLDNPTRTLIPYLPAEYEGIRASAPRWVTGEENREAVLAEALLSPLDRYYRHAHRVPTNYREALEAFRLAPLDGRLGEMANVYGPIEVYRHPTEAVVDVHFRTQGQEAVVRWQGSDALDPVYLRLTEMQLAHADPPVADLKRWFAVKEGGLGPGVSPEAAGLLRPGPVTLG